MISRHISIFLGLAFCLALSSCAAAPKTLGVSSTTVTKSTKRIESIVRMSLPLENLPQLPENPVDEGFSVSASLLVPQHSPVIAATLTEGPISVETIPGLTGEVHWLPGNRWRFGAGFQANTEGPADLWMGGGKGLPLGKAEVTIRLGGGVHRIQAENTFRHTIERKSCPESGSCTITRWDDTTRSEIDTWRPFGRIAFSVQPLRSGPWAEIQAATPFTFAQWNGSSTTTTTTTRKGTEEECQGVIGPCTEEEQWSETENTSDESADHEASVADWSIGAGWVARTGSHQWVAGMRWHPKLRATSATIQWSFAVGKHAIDRSRAR